MVPEVPKYIPGQLRSSSKRFLKNFLFSTNEKKFLPLHVLVVPVKNEILPSHRAFTQGQKRLDHPKNAIFQSLRYCHHNQTWGKDTSYLSQFGPKNILRPLPTSRRQLEKIDPMGVLNSILWAFVCKMLTVVNSVPPQGRFFQTISGRAGVVVKCFQGRTNISKMCLFPWFDYGDNISNFEKSYFWDGQVVFGPA